MNRIALLAVSSLLFPFFSTTSSESPRPASLPVEEQKIQAAILLDVSGSMDGLIEQAKAQLWNMVSVMGRAKCENGNPKIEIALYEYGRTTNERNKGYIKQISPFTADLDKLSAELFKLTTNGGDEYCGQVIYTSLNELGWDKGKDHYKVIFIAGNEDFLQGTVTYTRACEEARKKGVIVNTIYCGNREQGIREHWNLAGECGSGSFTHIDQNAKFIDIPTPYDSVLFSLNTQLNNTYIHYGRDGERAYEQQAGVDKLNAGISREVAAKRVSVKGRNSLYNNASWDLIDAVKADSTILEKVELKTLPASLRNKSRAEIENVVRQKSLERILIQQRIAGLSVEREGYVARERIKIAGEKTSTLESEIERIIRDQAKRFNMKIE